MAHSQPGKSSGTWRQLTARMRSLGMQTGHIAVGPAWGLQEAKTQRDNVPARPTDSLHIHAAGTPSFQRDTSKVNLVLIANSMEKAEEDPAMRKRANPAQHRCKVSNPKTSSHEDRRVPEIFCCHPEPCQGRGWCPAQHPRLACRLRLCVFPIFPNPCIQRSHFRAPRLQWAQPSTDNLSPSPSHAPLKPSPGR